MIDQSVWWVPLVAGLCDAINPSVFLVTAFLLLFDIAREGKGRKIQAFYLIIVTLVVVVLNMGFDIFLLDKVWVVWGIKAISVVLSVLLVVLAYGSFCQWRAWHQHALIEPLWGQLILGYLLKKRWIAFFLVTLLGWVVGLVATQWPADMNFSYLSNALMMRSDFKSLFGLWLLYTLGSFTPVWVIMGLWYGGSIPARLKPLFTCAVLLAASTVVVFAFK